MNQLKSALKVSLLLYGISVLTTMAGMELLGWLSFALVLALSIGSATRSTGALPPSRAPLEYIDFFLIALAGVIALSAMLSVSPDANRLFIIGSARFVLLFLGLRFALEMTEEKSLFRGIRILVPIVGVIAVYAIFQHFTGIDLIRGNRISISSVDTAAGRVFRANGMWGHPVTFGHSMALTFCMVMGLAFTAARDKSQAFSAKFRALVIIVALLSGLALLSSYTRGAWIGAGAAFVVIGLYQGRKVATFTLSSAVLAMTLALSVSEHLRSRLLSIFSSTNQSNLERIQIWKANIQMFQEHPFLGVGYGENERLIRVYFEKLGILNGFGGHAHNNYLQFLSGTGLVGFFLFVAFSVAGFVMTHRLLTRLPREAVWPRALALGALAAQVALHVGGLTECNFKDAEVNHQYMLILAVVVVLYRRYVRPSDQVSGRPA
ncbi:MAG: O-antigen ligase family protein [Bdellovibrionaceae bacterium]|nr:O-antigen ligase family protein [Pseudobdellovibrionaceae bacterium]